MVRRKTIAEDDSALRRRKSERIQDTGTAPMPAPSSVDAVRAAHEKRLKILESENYTSARGVATEETFELEDDDVQLSVGARQKKKKLKSKKKTVKSLATVIQESEFEQWPPHIPNYTTVAAGPPLTVPRHFSSVCDGLAPYTCPRCGMRFCSQRCLGAHRDTRCLKFFG
eukprot:EC726298.1.p1 GENE.EC726298.1~~EC726298.1.p1  ORF type:complete len:170 (+),score=24.38 EC726298.1:98-607(+)